MPATYHGFDFTFAGPRDGKGYVGLYAAPDDVRMWREVKGADGETVHFPDARTAESMAARSLINLMAERLGRPGIGR